MTELSRETRKWAMLCHMTALVGLLGNGVGFLLGPLLVWLLKREDHPYIDEQGKRAVNFQITMLLALLLCLPLVFVLVGIPLMIIIALFMTILPIIGAIKANNGEDFSYPLAIRFLK